uniref:Acyltransferase 3 domain-containing protein n=1 Tax=Knufia peltigerae TaxID=1002370 RepID=A0AA38Y1G2_9EURO|nr:hypothetical protein H2204_007810 [Knufia peltigerae]
MNMASVLPYLVAIAVYLLLAYLTGRLPQPLRSSVLAGTEKDDPAITATRGIAAVSVLCAHSFDYASNKPAQTFFASFGVCVFFIITGYLFFSMVRRDRFNMNSFFKKRILRLVPAAYMAVAIIQFLDWAQWGFPAFDTRQLNALVRNFMFGFVGDMFGVTAIHDLASIVQKMGMIWTLKWEWLFYLAFPLAVAAAGKSLPKLFLVTAALYVGFYSPADILRTATGNYMLLFLMGASCAVIHERMKTYHSGIAAAGWLAWLAIIVTYIWISDVEHLMGGRVDYNLLITAPFFLLVLYSGKGNGLLMRWARAPGVQMLGIISYSFYLYHMTVIYYSQHAARRAIELHTPAADLYTYLSLVPVGMLVTVIAIVSYLQVEKRFMYRAPASPPVRVEATAT